MGVDDGISKEVTFLVAPSDCNNFLGVSNPNIGSFLLGDNCLVGNDMAEDTTGSFSVTLDATASLEGVFVAKGESKGLRLVLKQKYYHSHLIMC